MPEFNTLESDSFAPDFSIGDAFDADDMLPLPDPLSDDGVEASADASGGGRLGTMTGLFAALTSWTGAVADVDDAPSGSASGFWSAYSGQFIRQVIVAFAVGLVCNGFWGIPLYQVVDVNLALSLSFLILLVVMLGVILFLELFNQMWREALESVFYIVTSIFLPFGAIVGYMIYGALGGGDVTSSSFVYKIYVGLFADTYAYVASMTGDVLGAISKQRNATGELTATVNMQLFMDWVPIAASVATILNFFRDFSRPRVPAGSGRSTRSTRSSQSTRSYR